MQYKSTYEGTAKVQGQISKYQKELNVMRKELKMKQKTLSTYEYLMKLPAEKEAEVMKCKHCPKFFASRDFVQKHY